MSLGGAYEEPDNPQQAAISKIARQFMTKLHIQVNQTMQFYRGQQGGTAPQRLFLSGGASIMPYTAQFFAEKLNVPVEYFNPFRSVQIDPAINLEELSRVAHGLGEVVGLGLRNLATCPVEMNLMPDSTLRWQTINQKKPYFVATVFSLVLVAFGVGFLFQKLAVNKESEITRLEPQVADVNSKVDRFNKAYKTLQKTQAESGQITTWLQQRYYWGDLLAEIRRALIRSEADIQKKLAAQKPNQDVGIWIEQMTSAANIGNSGGGVVQSAMMPNPEMGMPPSEMPPPSNPESTATTNLVTMVFRAVNLTSLDPSANSEIAYAVENEIKNSPMVDPKATQLTGQIVPDDANGTFTFTVNVAPLNPLNF